MTNLPIIETDQLTKAYGHKRAVQNISLSVKPHHITAFLGLNGAGKSTTIKMLLGMIHPTSGNGRILGRNIADEAGSCFIRKHVAYVGENKQLYSDMTVGQIVKFTRSFYEGWRSETEQKLLSTYGLPLNAKIRTLSKGMRTKLALLLAFARHPEVLILDEPSEGLDPLGIEEMLQSLVYHNGEGTTVFFSSHQIPEAERVADHVCVLHRGLLVLDASLDYLRESYQRIDMVFPTLPDESDIRIAGVERIRSQGRQMCVLVSKNGEMVIERARRFQPSSVQTSTVGLRDIFLEKVKEGQ